MPPLAPLKAFWSNHKQQKLPISQNQGPNIPNSLLHLLLLKGGSDTESQQAYQNPPVLTPAMHFVTLVQTSDL